MGSLSVGRTMSNDSQDECVSNEGMDDELKPNPGHQGDVYVDVDPLREDYRRSVSQARVVLDNFAKRNVALLVIDLQYLDAAEGYGVFAPDRDHGVPAAAQKY